MTASAIKVGLRKTEKVKKGRVSQKRYYWDVIQGSGQEVRGYEYIERLRHGKPINWNFGIKSFYPKIRGHVFTPKFRRRVRELAGFQDCADQGVDCVKIDICRFGCDTGISSL